MKKVFALLMLIASALMPVFAKENASTEFNIALPKYIKVESVLSPVLTANITNRSGNLHAPLISKYRVISNSAETKTFYLKAHTVTDAGQENAMFEQSGQVYIAFANLANIPKSQSLANCKIGSQPQDSPGIVAYPVLSVNGIDNKFVQDKYEVYIKNGISYLTINIGPHVLRSSFASNDTKGFYQTVISLTEADI